MDLREGIKSKCVQTCKFRCWKASCFWEMCLNIVSWTYFAFRRSRLFHRDPCRGPGDNSVLLHKDCGLRTANQGGIILTQALSLFLRVSPFKTSGQMHLFLLPGYIVQHPK